MLYSRAIIIWAKCAIFQKKKMADFSLLILWFTLGKAVLQGVVSGGLYYDCRWNRQGEYANVNKYITFIKKNSLVRFMFFVSTLMSKWLDIRKFFTLAQIFLKRCQKLFWALSTYSRVPKQTNKNTGCLFICLGHSLKSIKGKYFGKRTVLSLKYVLNYALPKINKWHVCLFGTLE